MGFHLPNYGNSGRLLGLWIFITHNSQFQLLNPGGKPWIGHTLADRPAFRSEILVNSSEKARAPVAGTACGTLLFQEQVTEP